MKTRNSALFALGLAAALTLGGSMTASAQDTTTRARSQRRIPVRKEQPAPQPARVDTVTITRTDTVVRTRTDTVTVTRVDTVTRIEELPLQRLPGWQFWSGTGMDIPTQEWLNVASIGWTAHAHLGWFPGTSPVGIRVDGDYSNFGARELDCPNCSSTKLWQLSGVLEWRIPLDRKSKVNPQIYFLGGGGFDWFTDFVPYRKQDHRHDRDGWQQDGHDVPGNPGRDRERRGWQHEGSLVARRRSSARRILHRVAVQEHQHGWRELQPRAGPGWLELEFLVVAFAVPSAVTCGMLDMMRTAEEVNFTSSAV